MLSFIFYRREISFLIKSLVLIHLSGYISTIKNDNTDSNNQPNSTLSLVQILFRHGDRSPIMPYPTDQYQSSAWKYGLGELTDVGAQQAFELGTYLRQRYLEFNLHNLSNHQVFVRSTSVPRAYMTAQCVMAGIVKPDSVTSFNPREDTQHITVHKVDENEDTLLSMVACPKYDKLLAKWKNTSSVWSDFTAKYKELFKYLGEHTGMEVNGSSVHDIADAVFCEDTHNLTHVEWISDKVPQLINIYRKLGAFVAPTPEMQQLKAGPLIDKMLQNIHEKIAKKDNKMKLYVYSAHDTNVMSLLSALGISNGLRPPYVSCMIVELHRVDGMSYVRVLYRNTTSGEPRVMKIPGCEELCHIATLHQLVKNVTLKAQDMPALCGPTWGSITVQENIIPIIVIAVLLVTMVITGVVYLVRRRQKQSTKAVNYRQLLHGGTEGGLLDSDDDELL